MDSLQWEHYCSVRRMLDRWLKKRSWSASCVDSKSHCCYHSPTKSRGPDYNYKLPVVVWMRAPVPQLHTASLPHPCSREEAPLTAWKPLNSIKMVTITAVKHKHVISHRKHVAIPALAFSSMHHRARVQPHGAARVTVNSLLLLCSSSS